MTETFVPYRHNNYTDVLVALGTAHLIATLRDFDEQEVRIVRRPGGFAIRHPESDHVSKASPFWQIKDKADREVDRKVGTVWDKTEHEDQDRRPNWWTTVSVINTLGSPRFNNRLARQYTPDLGLALLEGEGEVQTNSRSQLLYAPASKGTNASSFRGTPTRQGNLSAGAEQMIALLGYQVGAAGFIKDDYTISVVPRPENVSLAAYRTLVDEFLRGYLPRATSDKILPTSNQTLPFFLSMMYFDVIIKLFQYREEAEPMFDFDASPSEVLYGLDRATYFSMGTSSAPFRLDSLRIPSWLDEQRVPENVRDLIRELLSERVDPRLLNLPVRAFTESDPRALVEFYRSYQPMQVSGNRSSKRLLERNHLSYIMEKTDYQDLDGEAMQRFAQAIRSRTLVPLYHSEQPDFDLLTKIRAASRNEQSLISMLSEFVGSYNLRNARLTNKGKSPDGRNLSYEHLKEIRELIGTYGPVFVANTLMAQAMSKNPASEDVGEEAVADTSDETSAPSEPAAA